MKKLFPLLAFVASSSVFAQQNPDYPIPEGASEFPYTDDGVAPRPPEECINTSIPHFWHIPISDSPIKPIYRLSYNADGCFFVTDDLWIDVEYKGVDSWSAYARRYGPARTEDARFPEPVVDPIPADPTEAEPGYTNWRSYWDYMYANSLVQATWVSPNDSTKLWDFILVPTAEVTGYENSCAYSTSSEYVSSYLPYVSRACDRPDGPGYILFQKEVDRVLSCPPGYEMTEGQCISVFELYPPGDSGHVEDPDDLIPIDPEPGDGNGPEYPGDVIGTPDEEGGWSFDFGPVTDGLSDVVGWLRRVRDELVGMGSTLDRIEEKMGVSGPGEPGSSDNSDLIEDAPESDSVVDDFDAGLGSELSDYDAKQDESTDFVDSLLDGTSEIGDGSSSPILDQILSYVPVFSSRECQPLEFLYGVEFFYKTADQGFSIECDKIELVRSWIAYLLYLITCYSIIRLFFRTDEAV